MAMKLQSRAAAFLACIIFVFAAGRGAADEVPLATGEHWTKSTAQIKKAYLVGIANLLQIERAYYGSDPPTDAQSLVPRFVRGVEGQTLDSVRETLDKWYQAHPDQLARPIIETIWFEVVMPELRRGK